MVRESCSLTTTRSCAAACATCSPPSPTCSVVAEAGDGAEAVKLAAQHAPIDLAILDVSMPRMTGLQAAKALAERPPAPKILMLSMHENEQFVFEALRAGATGFVLKTSADRELVAGLPRRPARRDVPAPDGGRRARARAAQPPAARTTTRSAPRELEVLKLVAEGHSSQEIAELLHISPKTVHRHRASILEKLGMRDRVELTRYAIRRGLVEP